MSGSTGSRAMLWLATVLLLAGSFGPAASKPSAQPALSEAEKLKAIRTQGDTAQRLNEARQRRWDAKMKAVSGSICNGC